MLNMAKDFLSNIDGDLSILNGDLEIGFSDEQHQEDILVAFKGDYKQYPLIGVGIENYLNSPVSVYTRQKFEKETTLQFASDNAENISVNYPASGAIEISATYE